MANSLDMQIAHEGHKNAIVKITGTLDDGDISLTPAISIDDFTNNEPRLELSGFRVDALQWTATDGLNLNIAWNGTNPQQIFTVSGHGELCAKKFGGFYPETARDGYDGNINLYSNGAPNSNGVSAYFTIILELIKLY